MSLLYMTNSFSLFCSFLYQACDLTSQKFPTDMSRLWKRWETKWQRWRLCWFVFWSEGQYRHYHLSDLFTIKLKFLNATPQTRHEILRKGPRVIVRTENGIGGSIAFRVMTKLITGITKDCHWPMTLEAMRMSCLVCGCWLRALQLVNSKETNEITAEQTK